MSLEYIAHHLLGAWRLLRGDESGFDHFDLTETGFWRSFSVMFLALPLIFIASLAGFSILVGVAELSPEISPEDIFNVPMPVYVTAQLLVSYIGWMVFLIVLAPMARILGAAANYARFVVTYNWAQLLILLLLFPVNVSFQMGWVSLEALLTLQVFLSLAFLVYSWFIVTVGLKVSKMDAAAVVALETAVLLVLGRIVSGIFTAFPPETTPV